MKAIDYSRYDAIVFDCDGTLVDTMPSHYVAWIKVLNRYGLTFPEDRFYRMGGTSTQKTVAILASEAHVTLDSHKVSLEKDEVFLESLSQIRPIDKVVAVAQQQYGKMPLGVATGATRRTAEAELRQVGIFSLFNTLVAADDVKEHKPFPDVYLEAAKRLGVKPHRCLAFEDTDIGLQAAESAGMQTIDVRIFLK